MPAQAEERLTPSSEINWAERYANPFVWCLMDGDIQPLADARISPFNRGFLFGDSVYEMIPVENHRLLAADRHLARLEKSAELLDIPLPGSSSEIFTMLKQLVERNPAQPRSGLYLQICRGGPNWREYSPPLDAFEEINRSSKSFLFAMQQPALLPTTSPAQLRLCTAQDVRWKLVHVKGNGLTGAVLLRRQAARDGYDDALLMDGDEVLEATASNVFVVVDGEVCTPPTSPHILAGITRSLVIDAFAEAGSPVSERPIYRSDLERAEEMWLTSSLQELAGVVSLDGREIQSGEHIKRAKQLFEAIKTGKLS